MKKLIQLFNEIHLIIEKHEYIRKEKGDNYNLVFNDNMVYPVGEVNVESSSIRICFRTDILFTFLFGIIASERNNIVCLPIQSENE